jgi:hypothetical protein
LRCPFYKSFYIIEHIKRRVKNFEICRDIYKVFFKYFLNIFS